MNLQMFKLVLEKAEKPEFKFPTSTGSQKRQENSRKTSTSAYACESWTIKKAEHQKTDAFELWNWRRFLRVTWTARSNLSILKGISPQYTLEGLKLKLMLQYFGHLIWRTDSLEKTLMLGRLEGRSKWGDTRWDGWMASPFQLTWVWASSGSWWRTGKSRVLQSMG